MIEIIFVLVFVLILFLALRGGATSVQPLMHSLRPILKARDHDMPYGRGPRVGFSDVVNERKYSLRTGNVGPITPIGINDRVTLRAGNDVYPR